MISRTDEKPLPNWNQKNNQRIGSPKQICELRRHQKGEKYSTSNGNVQSITILPTYLQFTMMLAVAVAGVPTPLILDSAVYCPRSGYIHNIEQRGIR